MGFLSTLGSFASTAGGGNVIGAGIAGIASLLGGLGQNKSQKDINATNLQIARETNANSLAIARENNAAQYKAMLDNNKWSRDTAIEMFNLENAYNTPEAQRQRLLAAGLNPAVVMNGSGSSVPANVSTPSAAGSTISPSMPSFVTPTLGAPPSVMLSAADAISKLASAGAQAAAAVKTRKEASWIDESTKAQIDEIRTRIINTEANTAYQNMIKQIEESNLPNKYKAEIAKLATSSALDILNGRDVEADIRLKDAETMLTKTNNKRANAELPLILSNLKQTFNVLKSQERANEASANASNAAADNSRAQAALSNALKKTEDSLRGEKKQQILNEIENGKYGRTVNMIETYLKAAGYNQPIWNLGAGLADTVADWLHGLFGKSKQIDDFIDFFKMQTQ